MKDKLVSALLSLLVSIATVSCVYEAGYDPEEDLLPSDHVFLNLRVNVAQTRLSPLSRQVVDDLNYFEAPVSEYEYINTLRVIIVRTSADGLRADSIEHNRKFVSAVKGSLEYDNMTFKVKGGENKRVYLIANEDFVCANTGYDFNKLAAGTPYPAGELESITLTRQKDSPLIDNRTGGTYVPMSECFSLSVPKPADPGDRYIFKDMFITRAAVKFSFIFRMADGTGEIPGMSVGGIRVDGLADSEYLMPRATVYDPAKHLPADTPLGGRFITDYEIPAAAAHTEFAFTDKVQLKQLPDSAFYHPLVYLPESRKGKYTVTIKVGDSEDEAGYFEPVTLPNLPMLPRNTHVVVLMTLTGTGVNAEVRLVPYTGVWLNPDFGIDRD